jgi:hypothetical protein
MSRTSLPAALLTCAVLGGLGLSAAGCGSDAADASRGVELSAGEARKALTATPWLDHMPASEADPIDLLQLDRRGRGVYVRGSAYRGTYDTFRYEATNDELRVEFLDGGARTKTGYKIERMKRKGFDLRLTLTASPRGPAVYYGFEGKSELPAAVQAVLQRGDQRGDQ